MTFLTRRNARPAYKKYEELTNYFITYSNICDKVTANLNSDRVLELGKRTAGILVSLNEFVTDKSLKDYAVEQTTDSGQYPQGYNVLADFSAMITAIEKVRDAVILLESSVTGTITFNANAMPIYASIDTSSLLTAVDDYKALVSNT